MLIFHAFRRGLFMQHSTGLSGIAEAYQKFGIEYEKRNWVLYTTGLDLGVESAYSQIVKLLKIKNHWLVVQQVLEKIGILS
jgi:hypothetical protein